MTPEQLMSRRQFGKSVAGIIAAIGTFMIWRGTESRSIDPRRVFVDLRNNFSTPEDVAAGFVRARTPVLMASYAVFFPDFLALHGRSAVEAIRKAAAHEKEQYRYDHHRLDALPAVTAAHYLRITNDDSAKQMLCAEISKALADPRREVREIVLQNLITSVAPNIDALRFFSVDQYVFSSLSRLIEHAETNTKLLTPVSLCAEFLLNAMALLEARRASKNTIAPYGKMLSRIQRSKAPHFRYVGRLIDIHRRTFSANPFLPGSLPPQSSEALMGWKQLPGSRDYLEQLALMRSRLMFVNLATTSGQLASDDVMTDAEAARALPKTLAFFREFDLIPLVNEDLIARAPKEDYEFRKFMRDDFRQLVQAPESFGISLADVQSREEDIALAECVPFSQYDNYALLNQLSREERSDDRRGTFKSIGGVLSSALAGYGAFKGYEEFCEALKQIIPMRSPPVALPSKEHIEKQAEILRRKEREIDEGHWLGLEEQERDLGGIPLPDPSNPSGRPHGA